VGETRAITSTDIVDRLRSAKDSEYVPVHDEDGYDGISIKLIENAALCHEAADEIEQLRALIDRVQSLHNPRGGRDDAGFFCGGCGLNPCPTRTLTDGEPIFPNDADHGKGSEQ
jgi:hypothetical protein